MVQTQAATSFLACLAALEVQGLRLEDLYTKIAASRGGTLVRRIGLLMIVGVGLVFLVVVGGVSLLAPENLPQPYNGKIYCEYTGADPYPYEDEYPPFSCSVRLEQVANSGDNNRDTSTHQKKSITRAFWVGIGRWLVRLFEDPIAGFTLVLTISTTFLWIETRRGAIIAERALTELERPWVFVELWPAMAFGPDPGGNEDIGSVVFSIANHGRGPAIITECRAGVSQIGFIPQGDTLRDEFHGVIGPGEKREGCTVLFPYGCKYTEAIPEIGIPDMPASDDSYSTLFQINLGYTGIGTKMYVSAFCWIWDHGVGRWVRFNGDRYNYRT